MKFRREHYILLVCFCLCVVGLLFLALRPTEAVVSLQEPPTQQELAAAEQALQEHQEELAGLLRAYYMGHASERETKRLIEQVEEERLHVEELRKTVL